MILFTELTVFTTTVGTFEILGLWQCDIAVCSGFEEAYVSWLRIHWYTYSFYEESNVSSIYYDMLTRLCANVFEIIGHITKLFLTLCGQNSAKNEQKLCGFVQS